MSVQYEKVEISQTRLSLVVVGVGHGSFQYFSRTTVIWPGEFQKPEVFLYIKDECNLHKVVGSETGPCRSSKTQVRGFLHIYKVPYLCST